jgi:hypothetical protein
MKKTLFIILLLIIPLANSYCQETEFRLPPIRLKTIIEIAKPRENCNSGFGFCGFWDNMTIARQAPVGFGIAEGKVIILFSTEELNAEMRNELERSSTFEIGRDVELKENISKALNLPPGSQLRPGTYTIFYREPYHVVQCPLL